MTISVINSRPLVQHAGDQVAFDKQSLPQQASSRESLNRVHSILKDHYDVVAESNRRSSLFYLRYLAGSLAIAFPLVVIPLALGVPAVPILATLCWGVAVAQIFFLPRPARYDGAFPKHGTSRLSKGLVKLGISNDRISHTQSEQIYKCLLDSGFIDAEDRQITKLASFDELEKILEPLELNKQQVTLVWDQLAYFSLGVQAAESLEIEEVECPLGEGFVRVSPFLHRDTSIEEPARSSPAFAHILKQPPRPMWLDRHKLLSPHDCYFDTKSWLPRRGAWKNHPKALGYSDTNHFTLVKRAKYESFRKVKLPNLPRHPLQFLTRKASAFARVSAITWRGDLRSPEVIAQEGGFLPRISVSEDMTPEQVNKLIRFRPGSGVDSALVSTSMSSTISKSFPLGRVTTSYLYVVRVHDGIKYMNPDCEWEIASINGVPKDNILGYRCVKDGYFTGDLVLKKELYDSNPLYFYQCAKILSGFPQDTVSSTHMERMNTLI